MRKLLLEVRAAQRSFVAQHRAALRSAMYCAVPSTSSRSHIEEDRVHSAPCAAVLLWIQ
jgi:hypothetical protein